MWTVVALLSKWYGAIHSIDTRDVIKKGNYQVGNEDAAVVLNSARGMKCQERGLRLMSTVAECMDETSPITASWLRFLLHQEITDHRTIVTLIYSVTSTRFHGRLDISKVL